MQERPGTRPATEAAVAPVDSPGETAPSALRVQILATEHWSLLATRSMLWSEAFTRVTIFLTVVSAAVVALALVAQTTHAGRHFVLFALLLLPVVLFLGIATYARLGAIDIEDARLVAGMNRLRRGYLDVAGDLEPYFLTASHDDEAGVLQTLGTEVEFPRSWLLQVLFSAHGVVGVVTSCLAGVLTGLVARLLTLPMSLAVAFAVVAALLVLAALVTGHLRQMRRLERTWVPRFPA